MTMSPKPNQIKPYQTKQIKQNKTIQNKTKQNLTLPYLTMSDLGPLQGDGPRPPIQGAALTYPSIVEYSHNNSKGKLQGDTSPNRVWIVLTLPYCTGSHTVQGPTEHREPQRHC